MRRRLDELDDQQDGSGSGFIATVNRFGGEFALGFRRWLRHLDEKEAARLTASVEDIKGAARRPLD